MGNATTMPVKIFCCYAHADEDLLMKLKIHLSRLLNQGLIDVWHDGKISAGSEWEQEIKEQLNSAQIILLLVSPDFMASNYINNVELKRAIERHQKGEARVIPIILRPVDWQGVPDLDKLQALPKDAKPVSLWINQDEAFSYVATRLRDIIAKMLAQTPTQQPQQAYTQQVQGTKVKLEAPLKRFQQLKWLHQHRLVVVLAIFVIVGGGIGSSYFFTHTHVPSMNPNPTSTASSSPTSVQLTRTVESTGTTSVSPTSTQQVPTTATVQAIATLNASLANPYPSHRGTLAVNDSLHESNGNWTNFAPDCQFLEGAYHLKAANASSQCDYKNASFNNFVLQIQMRFVTNNTCGGVIFGKQTFPYTNMVSYYDFHICTNGSYGLIAVGSPFGSSTSLRDSFDQAIHQGSGQFNLLAIVANGANLDLYVNGIKIDHVNVGTSSQGTMSLTVSSSTSGEVAFTDVKIWTL